MQHQTSELTNNHTWEEPTTSETETFEEAPDQQPDQSVYHVYIVKEPETATEIPPFVDETSPAPKRIRQSPLLVVIACITLVATLSGFATGVLLFQPSVTVTIFPEHQEVRTTTTLPVVSGKPHTADQLPGRVLPVITLSQQQTVKTTGVGHQEATPAYGQITFYNAAPVSQTIPAGTLLITAHGIQITTDTQAVLPAAAVPTMGQVTVPAHTVQTGPGSNIPAAAINGACCLVNIFARNVQPFAGGQAAREFAMVTKEDSAAVVNSLKTGLHKSIEAAYHTQLQPGEALLTPFSCQPTISTDHPVGSEATQLTVTVSTTCRALAYDKKVMQQLLVADQTRVKNQQGRSTYRLHGSIQITSIATRATSEGAILLTVAALGVWSYQFTPSELHQLTSSLAGKNRHEAGTLLLHHPGVKRISLTAETATLPTDPNKIHLAIIYEPLS